MSEKEVLIFFTTRDKKVLLQKGDGKSGLLFGQWKDNVLDIIALNNDGNRYTIRLKPKYDDIEKEEACLPIKYNDTLIIHVDTEFRANSQSPPSGLHWMPIKGLLNKADSALTEPTISFVQFLKSEKGQKVMREIKLMGEIDILTLECC